MGTFLYLYYFSRYTRLIIRSATFKSLILNTLHAYISRSNKNQEKLPYIFCVYYSKSKSAAPTIVIDLDFFLVLIIYFQYF